MVAHVSGYLNAIANLGTIVSPVAVGYVLVQPGGHAHALILLGVASVLAIISFSVGYSVLKVIRYQGVKRRSSIIWACPTGVKPSLSAHCLERPAEQATEYRAAIDLKTAPVAEDDAFGLP